MMKKTIIALVATSGIAVADDGDGKLGKRCRSYANNGWRGAIQRACDSNLICNQRNNTCVSAEDCGQEDQPCRETGNGIGSKRIPQCDSGLTCNMKGDQHCVATGEFQQPCHYGDLRRTCNKGLVCTTDYLCWPPNYLNYLNGRVSEREAAMIETVLRERAFKLENH